jgi:hypothetical protein
VTGFVLALFHWLNGRRVDANRRSAASSRLPATARCLSRHLHMNALRRTSISLTSDRIDHILMVGSDPVMQALRRVGQLYARSDRILVITFRHQRSGELPSQV